MLNALDTEFLKRLRIDITNPHPIDQTYHAAIGAILGTILDDEIAQREAAPAPQTTKAKKE